MFPPSAPTRAPSLTRRGRSVRRPWPEKELVDLGEVVVTWRRFLRGQLPPVRTADAPACRTNWSTWGTRARPMVGLAGLHRGRSNGRVLPMCVAPPASRCGRARLTE